MKPTVRRFQRSTWQIIKNSEPPALGPAVRPFASQNQTIQQVQVSGSLDYRQRADQRVGSASPAFAKDVAPPNMHFAGAGGGSPPVRGGEPFLTTLAGNSPATFPYIRGFRTFPARQDLRAIPSATGFPFLCLIGICAISNRWRRAGPMSVAGNGWPPLATHQAT